MKQLVYNLATNAIRLELPLEWDVKSITGIDLTIKDRDGDDILAATAATLWAQTTLDEDAARFADEVTLVTGATNLTIGDTILIEGIEGDEVRRVKGYDTTNKVVQLESILDVAHSDGENVWGRFATYTLDTTTVADYAKGQIVTFLWTPDDDSSPITELYQVAATSLDIAGLAGEFMDAYPRYYDLLTKPVDRLARVEEQAERQVQFELIPDGADIQRIVDQSVMIDIIMVRMALLSLNSADVQAEDERNYLASEYERLVGIFQRQVVWTDDDQDLVEDDGETTTHMPTFSGNTW